MSTSQRSSTTASVITSNSSLASTESTTLSEPSQTASTLPVHSSLTWTDIEQKLVKDFYNLHDLEQDQWTEDGPYENMDQDIGLSATVTKLGLESEAAHSHYVLSKRAQSRRRYSYTSSHSQPSELTSTYYDASFASGVALLDEDQHQDPLGLKGNMSKYLVITGKEEDEDLFDAVLISSKSFQPITFLRTLHKNTNFQDIEQGLENLQDLLEERIESMKNLVKQNFERFVNAKMVIDNVYDVMKKKVFNRPDSGLHDLFKSIDQWKKALKTSLEPVLLVKQESDALTKKLHVIQQFKFLFRLPTILSSAILMNQVDVAINDYRRGKVMIKSALHQVQDGQATLSRLWNCIESSARQMRSKLFERLDDPNLGIDVVEKYIVCLLEIESANEIQKDPVIHYIMSQERQIHKNIDKIKSNFHSNVEALNRVQISFDESAFFKIFIDQLAILVDCPMTEEYGPSPLIPTWDEKRNTIVQLYDIIHVTITSLWSWVFSVTMGKYESLYYNEKLTEEVTKVFDRITKHLSSVLLEISGFIKVQKKESTKDNEKDPLSDASGWDTIISGKSTCDVLFPTFSAIRNSGYPGIRQLYDCFTEINLVVIKTLLSNVQRDMTFFSFLLMFFHQGISHNRDRLSIKTETKGSFNLPDIQLDTYKKILSGISSSCRFSGPPCSFPTQVFCVWSQRILQECHELMSCVIHEAPNKDIAMENSYPSEDNEQVQLISQSIGRLVNDHWRGYLRCISSVLKSITSNAQSKELLVYSLIFLIKDIDWLRECFERLTQSCIEYCVSFDEADIYDLINSIENEVYVQLVKTLGEKFVSLIQENFIDSPVLSNDTLFPTNIRGYVFEILIDMAKLRFEMENALNHEKSELLIAKLELLLFHEMKDCLVDGENIYCGGFIQLYMEIHFFHVMLLKNESKLSDPLKEEQESLWGDILGLLEQLKNNLAIHKQTNRILQNADLKHSKITELDTQHEPHIRLDVSALESAMAIVTKSSNQCLHLSNIFQ